MKILFTKSDKIGSKLIRALTNEPVSHCALQWEDIVIHSSFGGIRIDFLSDFTESHEIVYETNIELDLNKIANLKPAPYDFGGFIYLGLRLCFLKFHISLPKKNLWQCTGMYMCTEFITKTVTGQEDSLITPYKLYRILSEKG